MSAPLPFDRDDLPRATRVVGAPVGEVYATVTAVERWPEWVPAVLDPVIAKGDERYLFRSRRDGRIDHNEGRVVLRGPTHTFGVQIDAGARVWFRTRPTSAGTKVDLVLEPVGAASWRQRIGGRRRRAQQEQWVTGALEGLTAHLAGQA